MMSSCSPRSRVLHWVVACLAALVASPALAQSSLPAPWSAADIGSPALTGSTTHSNGTFTVNGGGVGVTGRNDQFHFLYQRLSSDTMIIARIDGMTAADPESKVGVMFRESLSANSPNAFAYVSGTNVLGLSSRKSTGARTTVTPWGTGRPTGWLALRRQGSTLTGYASSDGSSWQTLATSSVPMGQTVYVGIAISARSSTQRAQALVSNVSFTGGLPNGQQAVDIGSPSPAGTTSFASNTYTINGGGANIGSNADQFHFVYQTVSGDVELVARVAAITTADAMSRVGVMVRASLSSNSAFAYTSLRACGGYGFEWRYTDGASASVTNDPTGAAPGWVRLTRRGQRFDAYRSSDGQTWTLIHSQDLTGTPLPSTVYVGLAVTSARAGASTTATVSNFAVSTNLSNTIVTSYRLNIYAAGADTLTDTPVATSDLGKPTPDAQQTITVDRGPFFTALPAGSYLATVTAIGPGGSAQSQPPVAFTR
jgi:regulation of enolase protein 1 (concanavalin A-like superfamily)